MLRCGTRATYYINRRCQCFSSHASKSSNTVNTVGATAAPVDKDDETIGDMKERAASLLAAAPPAYATKPGLSRTQFENEYHLNRSLSKDTITPEQRRIWQQQVKKRVWDLKPMEMHHSPPYEIQALQEIHNRSFDANVLLEIRDVRLPASSHHPSFTRLAKHRLHLICYTHADIIDPPTRDRVEEWTNKSWPGSRSIFVDTRENRSDLPYDLVYESLLGYLESRGGINAALTVGVPNTGKSSVLLALLRLARARGDIPKQIKATVSYKKKRRLGKTAPIGIMDQPGKTREITEYLLREKPRAFFLDVPGITPPTFFFQERPEAWFAFGAANLMPLSKNWAADVQVQTAFCDYVLYCLNRDGIFMYIPKLGLSGPTDDIEEVLFNVKQGRSNKDPEKLQLQRCASFLKLFNTGNLGPAILDDISKPYRKFEFKDSHFVKERETFQKMRTKFKRGNDDNHGDDYDDDEENSPKGDNGKNRGKNAGKDDFTEDDFRF
jgi:ribosome biogenesis GTPase A